MSGRGRQRVDPEDECPPWVEVGPAPSPAASAPAFDGASDGWVAIESGPEPRPDRPRALLTVIVITCAMLAGQFLSLDIGRPSGPVVVPTAAFSAQPTQAWTVSAPDVMGIGGARFVSLPRRDEMSTAVHYNDVVVVGATVSDRGVLSDSVLFGLDPANGETLWRSDVDGPLGPRRPICAEPWSKDILACWYREDYNPHSSTLVHLLDPRTGQQIGVHPVEGGVDRMTGHGADIFVATGRFTTDRSFVTTITSGTAGNLGANWTVEVADPRTTTTPDGWAGEPRLEANGVYVRYGSGPVDILLTDEGTLLDARWNEGYRRLLPSGGYVDVQDDRSTVYSREGERVFTGVGDPWLADSSGALDTSSGLIGLGHRLHDLSDGTVVWAAPTPTSEAPQWTQTGDLATYDGTEWRGSRGTRTTVAYDLSERHLAWRSSTDLSETRASTDGAILTTAEREIAAYDPADGSLIWREPLAVGEDEHVGDSFADVGVTESAVVVVSDEHAQGFAGFPTREDPSESAVSSPSTG